MICNETQGFLRSRLLECFVEKEQRPSISEVITCLGDAQEKTKQLESLQGMHDGPR